MKHLKWHKIAIAPEELLFGENGIAVTDINGRKVCIGKHEHHLYAFAYKCPHAGGIMADGFIDGSGNVVCPTHRYRFNMKNGRNVSGEGYYLKHWPLDCRPDGVFIGMEDQGLFTWL